MKDMSNSFLLQMPIAHRGLHDEECPENSLGAFKKAVDKNFAIELDVHLTKDGELAILHDDNFCRMCGVDTDFRKVESKDLKNYKLKGTKYYIPLLREVLAIVGGKVPLLIEIKYELYKRATKVGEIERKLVEYMKDYKGEWAIQSFNPISVWWFKKNKPEILRGQIGCKNLGKDVGDKSGYKDIRKKWGLLKLWAIRKMPLNFITKPDFINYYVADLRLVKKRKAPTLTWVVKTEEDYYNALKHDVENFIFEQLDILGLTKKI